MKIVLIGADGQLGVDIQKFITEGLVPLTLHDLDITKAKDVDKVICSCCPNVVINTAAYNKVDDAEKEDAIAYAVNAIGAKNVALACKKANAALVHISTDYVFDGDKKSPYSEEDAPDPKSAYGLTKLAGEYYVKYILGDHFIVRTSSLFGVAGCLGKGGGNFVETMLKVGKEKAEAKVVSDQIVSPTYTLDLAKKIVELIKTKNFGTYHITNKGQCSWFDFAKKIFELSKMKVDLKPVTSAEFKTPAHRPKYSVLKHGHLEKLRMDDLRSWEDALKAYLEEKGHIRR